MPGPEGQKDRQFFNAKNLLERKSLGDFLHELAALQVRCSGDMVVGWMLWWVGPNQPGLPPLPTHVQGPLAGPSKPPELVKLTTAHPVGEAMKVGAGGSVGGRRQAHMLFSVGSQVAGRWRAMHAVRVHADIQPPSYPPPQALAAYNILSAPVSDAISGEYVGMLDVGGERSRASEGGFWRRLDTSQRLQRCFTQNIGIPPPPLLADIMGGVVRGGWDFVGARWVVLGEAIAL